MRHVFKAHPVDKSIRSVNGVSILDPWPQLHIQEDAFAETYQLSAARIPSSIELVGPRYKKNDGSYEKWQINPFFDLILINQSSNLVVVREFALASKVSSK